MRHAIRVGLIAAVVMVTAGCFNRVTVPPAVDLRPHEIIGVVQFKCSAQGKLAGYITNRFVREIGIDQTIRTMDLGTEEDVLKEIGQSRLNVDAIKMLGEKHGIRSILIGELDLSDIRPKIHISPGFSYVGASADVEAMLTARLVDALDGTTIWSGNAHDERNVGYVSLTEGHFFFDAEDPEQAYGELARELTRKATKDFRVTQRMEWR